MPPESQDPGIPKDEVLREGYVDRLTQYLQAEPGAWHLRYNLGVALLHQGRTDEALEQLRTVLQYAPKHLQSLVNIGCIHLGRGDADGALRTFTSALTVWDLPLVRANLAVAYLQLGQLKEAVRHLEIALALDANLPDAWTNLGSALLRLDRLEESVEASRKALAIRPDLAMAHNNLGLALLAMEQVEEAKSHIATASDQGYPVHPDLLAQLGL
jgi:tetratricopeptide (TPR) repeat protein